MASFRNQPSVGGRVLAGEDSEEDDEELDFQYTAPQSLQAIAKQDLDKVDHEEASCIVNESDVSSPLETEFKSEDQDAVVKNQEQASKEWEELQRYLTRSSNRDLSTLKKAVTIRLQHVLDAAIHRIDDLLVNQERLLDNVNALGNSFIGNDEIEAIEKTMAKLPKYTQKIENIQKAMSTISESIEKLKCRSESLRIDAQSFAIKKEDKRDELSQWNKFYAVKCNDPMRTDIQVDM